MKRLAATAAVLAAGLGVMAGPNAAPAAADSAFGCPYPYVCFYKTWNDFNADRPTAMFKDRGWQNLGSNSRGADVAYNSRNDDAVWFKYSSGRQTCLEPSRWDGIEFEGTVTQVNIVSSAHC